tara:strand:- start:615 stop:803 length:189 start_codon:yes stop_codon:yes gene_type:complete
MKKKLTRKRKYQQVIQQMQTNQLKAVLKQPSIFVTKMHLAIIKLELRKRSQAIEKLLIGGAE